MKTPEQNAEDLKNIDVHLGKTDARVSELSNEINTLKEETERLGTAYEHVLTLNKEMNGEIGALKENLGRYHAATSK